MEEKFRNELNANIKLSNLYKVFMTFILPCFLQMGFKCIVQFICVNDLPLNCLFT